MKISEIGILLNEMNEFHDVLKAVMKEYNEMSQAMQKHSKEKYGLGANLDSFYAKAFLKSGISLIECTVYVFKE